MAITTVQVLGVEGGYGSVIFGAETGDSTRTITISAVPISDQYRFVEWEIVMDDSSTDNTTGTGTGGTSGGGPSDGADEIQDSTLIDSRI